MRQTSVQRQNHFARTRRLSPSSLLQSRKHLGRYVHPSRQDCSIIHRTQIYSMLLVFVTQKLSTRRDLQTHQTLTATHDNAAAWTGLGSAVSSIWNQRAIPASIMGVVSVFLYLGNILVLHITTPALFSLNTFNASHPPIVQTEGLPTINQSLGL
jgi:hypothetical protein